MLHINLIIYQKNLLVVGIRKLKEIGGFIVKLNKARIGFLLGIIVALLIGTADIPGLARNGQICMALSFMTVIFWGFQIAQPGYTSGLYLLLLAVFGVEKPGLFFSTWTGPMMFLIVGAYLIAGCR